MRFRQADRGPDRRQINGLAATALSGSVAGPQGRPRDVRLTVVSGPGGRNDLLIHAARDAAALPPAVACPAGRARDEAAIEAAWDGAIS